MIREDLNDLLVFDIETISQYKDYKALSEAEPKMAQLFTKKMRNTIKKETLDKIVMLGQGDYHDETVYELYGKAGLYPEFAKTLCISYGTNINGERRTFSFSGEDEVKVLTEFADLLRKTKRKYPNMKLSGFNIKGFDIPFVCRRMLINKIPIPDMINFEGKKPWEIEVFDLMQYWKYGGFDNPSLDLLANVYGLDSSKEIMNNDEVGDMYWIHNAVDKIKEYCEADVRLTWDVIEEIKNIK